MADEEKIDTAPQDGREWSSDPRTQAAEKRVVGLKDQNMIMLRQIMSVGGSPELGIPRIEHFISWLRQSGAFTYDEQLEEEEAWQKSMRSQLKPIIDQIRAASRLQGVPEQTPSGIVISRGHGGSVKQ